MLPLLACHAALAAAPPVDTLLERAETDRAGAIEALRALDEPGATAWADWLAAPPAPDAPDAPARLRAVGDASAARVPCWMLRDRPDAVIAFGGWYGSSRDASPSICHPALLDTPPWQALDRSLGDVAVTLEARSLCGTMAIGTARGQHVRNLARHLRGQPRDAAAEQARADALLGWARGLGPVVTEAQLAALASARSAARAAGPAWWVDAAIADRLGMARDCIGEDGGYREPPVPRETAAPQ
jgi:hypothetical protein